MKTPGKVSEWLPAFTKRERPVLTLYCSSRRTDSNWFIRFPCQNLAWPSSMNPRSPTNRFLMHMQGRLCPSSLPKSDDTLQDVRWGGRNFARSTVCCRTQPSPPALVGTTPDNGETRNLK